MNERMRLEQKAKLDAQMGLSRDAPRCTVSKGNVQYFGVPATMAEIRLRLYDMANDPHASANDKARCAAALKASQ